jgi:hydrogenase maturation factor HypF (carbamoyltransferase family)
MQLIYEITFNSKSQYIKNSIRTLIKKNNIEASCEQNSHYIYIICNDTQENIEAFFKILETALPLSIFMQSSKVIDALPSGVAFLEDNEVQPVLSLSNEEVSLILKNNDALQKQNALKLQNEEIVKLKTSRGECHFAQPSAQNLQELMKISSCVHVFIANTAAFETLFTPNQKDVQLLCSIERPLVKLKLNYHANQHKQYSQTNTVYAKMPYDKATFLLAYEVHQLGLNALLCCQTNACDETIKVGYLEQNTYIVEGNAGLFPKYDQSSSQVFKDSKSYFEHHGGVFKATLSQFNKRTSKCMGVYLTTHKHNSEIAVYTPKQGKKSVINVPNIHLGFSTNLEEISDIDDNTQRLIENFKKKFPKLFENIDFEFEASHGFASIINLMAYILEFKDAQAFEAAAENATAKSGVKIDMKVIKLDGVNYLDYRRIVQSMMSYRLAGVNRDLLAFSFYESLSEFVVQTLEQLKEEFECSDVIVCGNMIANKILLEKTQKALNKTFNVMMPKEYPLDYDG